MDEELKRLERAFRESPDDEIAGRAYRAALLRVGKREAVRALYTVKFRCPLTWEQLDPDDELSVKHCKECDRQVHFVSSETELAACVKRGECVAVTHPLADRCFDGFVDDPELHPAKDETSPCIVPAARRPVPALMGIVAAPPPFTPSPRPANPPPPPPPRESWLGKIARRLGGHSGS